MLENNITTLNKALFIDSSGATPYVPIFETFPKSTTITNIATNKDTIVPFDCGNPYYIYHSDFYFSFWLIFLFIVIIATVVNALVFVGWCKKHEKLKIPETVDGI